MSERDGDRGPIKWDPAGLLLIVLLAPIAVAVWVAERIMRAVLR